MGAGIAGLYTGIEWLKKNPAGRCCILEKNHRVGGRIATFHTHVPGHGALRWEGGAGRISSSHRRVRQLLTTYGLTYYPLQGEWDTPFTALADVYLPPLRRLSPRILSSHTLAQLLPQVYGHKAAHVFMQSFPYFSEFHTLRADLALEALQGELHTSKGFGVCAEGLDQLIHSMVEDFTNRGGILQQGITVRAVDWKPILSIEVEDEHGTHRLTPSALILAVPAPALRSIHGTQSFSFLKHLRMEPLLRIYAVFPVRQGKSWFSDQSTTVFDSPVRFFIPIRANQGVAMISYTEGNDAKHWMAMPPKQREKKVMEEVRKAFPLLTIPDPLRIQFHPWTHGCTYWLPGNYDPREESEKSIQPVSGKNLFLCNESYAVMQSWMESSLVQADKVLEKL